MPDPQNGNQPRAVRPAPGPVGGFWGELLKLCSWPAKLGELADMADLADQC